LPSRETLWLYLSTADAGEHRIIAYCRKQDFWLYDGGGRKKQFRTPLLVLEKSIAKILAISESYVLGIALSEILTILARSRIFTSSPSSGTSITPLSREPNSVTLELPVDKRCDDSSRFK